MKLTGLSGAFDRNVFYTALKRRAPDLLLTAESDGRVVGTVMALQEMKIGYVFHLAVHPAYQQQKIGSTLLEEVSRQLRLRNARFAFLAINRRSIERQRLVKFYTRHGFRRVIGTVFMKRL